MLKGIRRWLGVKTGVPVGANNHSPVRPAGTPSFEQLEPRLLLDADLTVIQPALTYNRPSAEQAVHVDLDRRDGFIQTDLSPALTIDVAPCDEANQSSPTPVLSDTPVGRTECGVAIGVPLSDAPAVL